MRMKSEDAGAFFLREYPRLVGGLALYVGDVHVAAELAQGALLRALRRWGHVRRLDSPGGWTWRVALNLAASHRRRQRVATRASRRLEAGATDSDRGPDAAVVLAVREAVASFPHRQRTALILRFYLDWSIDETAARMEVSPDEVRSLSERAVARLRELVGETDTSQLAKEAEDSELARALLWQAAPTSPAESATFDRFWERARRQRQLVQAGTGLACAAVLAIAVVWGQQLTGSSPATPGMAAQSPSSGAATSDGEPVAGDPVLSLDVGSSWQVTVSPGQDGRWCIGAHTDSGQPPEAGDPCDPIAGPTQGETIGSARSDIDAAGADLRWGTIVERVDEVWVAFDDGTMTQAASTTDQQLGFGVYAFRTEDRTPVRLEARQDSESLASRPVGEAAEPGGRLARFCEAFDELHQRLSAEELADQLGVVHGLAPPTVAEPLALVRDYRAQQDGPNPSNDPMPELKEAIREIDAYVAAVCGRWAMSAPSTDGSAQVSSAYALSRVPYDDAQHRDHDTKI